MSTNLSSGAVSRRQRERARHRQEILAAAERLFARRGYRGTTIEEIAKEANFAVGTIYLLFKGKDDLYLRVSEELTREFVAQFEGRILPLVDAREAVAAVIDLRVAHYLRHQDFLRATLEAMPALRVGALGTVPAIRFGCYGHYLQALRDIMRRGIAQGVFVPVDPLGLALALEGTVHALIANWSRHKRTRPWGNLAEELKCQFLETIGARRPEISGGTAQAMVENPVPLTMGDMQ